MPNAQDIEDAIQSCIHDLTCMNETPAIRKYIYRNTVTMKNAWNERRHKLRYDEHLLTCPSYAHFICQRELYYIEQNHKIMESEVKKTTKTRETSWETS